MRSNWIDLKCSSPQVFISQPKNEKTIHSGWYKTDHEGKMSWAIQTSINPTVLNDKRELLNKAKCASEVIQVIHHITTQMILVISRTSVMIVSKCFVRIIYNKLMYRIEGNVLCKRCAHGELIAILHASLDFNIGRHIDQISKWNRWGKYSHSHSVQNQNGFDAYSNFIITFILWDGRPWDKNKPLLDWEWHVYWLTCFNIKFDFFTVDHVCWAGENTIFKFTTPRTVSKSFIWVVVIFYNNLWSDVIISLFKITESQLLNKSEQWNVCRLWERTMWLQECTTNVP